MKIKRNALFLSSITALAILAGCGGGAATNGAIGSQIEFGGNGPATGPGTGTQTVSGAMEGHYSGGTGSGSDFVLLETIILENGEFWIFGEPLDGAISFIHGKGSYTETTLKSNLARIYATNPPIKLLVDLSYNQSQGALQGNIIEPITAVSELIAVKKSLFPYYTYNQPANLNSISGDWTLNIPTTNETIDINVSSSNGTFSSISSDGCPMTGKFTPRASGKNIFNMTLTFGNGECLFPGKTVSGIAYSQIIESKQILTTGTINEAENIGFTAAGYRFLPN